MKTRKFAAVLLALSIAFSIASCSKENAGSDESSESVKKNQKSEQSSEKIPDETIPEETEAIPEVDPQIYYDYVKNSIIPEEGLARVEDFTMQFQADEDTSIIINAVDGAYVNSTVMEERMGLLSCDIRDYNGDGIIDMITSSVHRIDSNDSMIMQILNRDLQVDCFALDLKFYTIEDNQVVLKDERASITDGLDTVENSLMLSVFDGDDIPYIVAGTKVSMYYQDFYSASTVYHIEGDSIVFDNIYGSTELLGSDDEFISVDDFCNRIDVANTDLNNKPVLAYATTFTNRVDCSSWGYNNMYVLGFVDVSVGNTSDCFKYIGKDYSFIREGMDNGTEAIESAKSTRLDGCYDENYDGVDLKSIESKANELIGKVSDSTGESFTLAKCNYYVDRNSFSASFEYTVDGSIRVIFQIDNNIKMIHVRVSTFQNGDNDARYREIKDIVLDMPEFLLEPDDANAYKGKVKINPDPIQTTSYEISGTRDWVDIYY